MVVDVNILLCVPDLKTNLPDRAINGVGGEGLAAHEIDEDRDVEGEGISQLLHAFTYDWRKC